MSPSSSPELWAQLDTLPLVEQTWPTKRAQSFMEWREESDPEGTLKLREEIEFVRQFAILPIVAVAGLINSGKSSLVAAFLSPAGRERVLRGEDRRHGTQRFTLWYPAAWSKNAALLGQLEGMLERVFGHAPEPLGLAPTEAHGQQRAIDLLDVPLLAFDEALDRRGIALFDCPDIQRAQPGEEAGANARLQFLSAAGEVCAGVILVSPRNGIEVRELQNIADRLPAATRIYAVNFLRRETPDEFLRDAPHIRNHGDACYVAYDFEVEANRDFAPAIDPNFQAGADPNPQRRVPFFFEALPEQEQNSRTTVTTDRSLTEIGPRLSPEALRQHRQSELTSTLRKTLAVTLGSMNDTVTKRRRELIKAVEHLFDHCYRLMHVDGQQRIKMDPEIVLSLAQSTRRTAPLDIKAALFLNHGIVTLIEKLGGVVSPGVQVVLEKLIPAERLRKVNEFLHHQSKEESFITSEKLQTVLSLWSAGVASPKDKAFWRDDAIAIMERLRVEERTNMSPEEWDEITREAWKSAPKMRARFVALVPFLLALLAAAAIPFDPTTTTTHAILGITFKEVVGVAIGGGVFGGLFGLAGSGILQDGIEKQIGRQQFSNFFAIASDRIGLPRDIPPSRKADFPPPRIPRQPNLNAFGIRERGWLRARINPANLDQLYALLGII
ncbi:MAG: hypothetical protein WA705_29210 [Candidatus Ozemobacteraceae bacterium]